MLRVTIDIFSGRPNPTWIVGADQSAPILREIALHPGIVVDSSHEIGGLGYRRVILDQLDGRMVQEYGLPRAFAIADAATDCDTKGIEIAQKLIDGAALQGSSVGGPTGGGDAIMTADTRKFFSCQIGRATRPATMMPAPADEVPPETMLPSLSSYETTPFEADHWNDPTHIRCNNCYAYAANRRTDTFAQPGRASGREPASFTFEEIMEAAVNDGAVDAANGANATEAPRYLVALFIWPGHDYHWYRLHSDGSWGHKPGTKPVRTVDNVGTSILDPRVCSRADYSDFCGFLIIPKQCRIR